VLQDYEATQESKDKAVALHPDKRKLVEQKEVVTVAALDTTVEDVSEDLLRDSITPVKGAADAALPALPHAEHPAGDCETGSFGSQHLACVLGAAVASQKDMKELVAYVKTKSNVFKVGVPLSSKSDGAYNKVQLAESIVKCRSDGVTTAHELLSWLVVSAAK